MSPTYRVRPLTGLALVLVLVSAGCATRQADVFRAAGGGEEGVLVTVQNHDYRDATIYANWNGPRQRVGFVVGKTTETFRMTWRDYTIRFEIDFVGGGGFQTESFEVYDGEHFDVVIQPGW